MMAPKEVYTFVEVFGGSCWCSLNVSRRRFKVIIANDIDSTLINIYRLVKESPDELVKKLSIMPFSRELYEVANEILNDNKADQVTKAVMLFYLIRASMFGKVGGGNFAVRRLRSGAKVFTDSIFLIKEYAKKFRDVTLENRDYKEVIKLYDSKHTLFYLDPPYVSTDEQSRGDYYRYSFTREDLWVMSKVLRDVKGYWVLKISDDNYPLVKEDLPQHNTTHIETCKRMQDPIVWKKQVMKDIIAHNINIPKEASLKRWL
jgi:DNA adenine methylase